MDPQEPDVVGQRVMFVSGDDADARWRPFSATLEWVDRFNHGRSLEPIGYVQPAEFEDACRRPELR